VKGDGQGRANYEIAKSALSNKHNLLLVGSVIDSSLRLNQSVKYKIIKVDRFPTDLIRNLVFACLTWRWLLKNKSRYDLLVVNGFITWSNSDVNIVNFVHNFWLRYLTSVFRNKKDIQIIYQLIFTKLNSLLEIKAFKNSAKIVAVSEQIKTELEKIGVKVSSIFKILNGVDTEEFFPGKPERRKLNLPEKLPLAVFVGDIRTPRKNLDTVLKALRKVPGLHLVVIGGTKGSQYPLLSKKLGIEKRVHFLGFRKDVAEIMRACDFLVFPSRYEACSLVIMEALASGLPVITAKSAGGSEVLDKKSGIVLENPDDVNGLVTAISYLLDNESERRRMGKSARKVAEKYSWKDIAEKYLTFFEEVYHEKKHTLY
jgi:glycosyltransferase involved in cell wall biosynthesis